MENNLRNKISTSFAQLSKMSFDELIKKEKHLSMYSHGYIGSDHKTSEQLKKETLEELDIVGNDKSLREAHALALDFNNSVNEKELQPQLFQEVHQSLEKCFTSCHQQIEAISFQYNYTMQNTSEFYFSCLCWNEGEYGIYDLEKYIKMGNIIYDIPHAVNVKKWIQPIQIFEDNEPFMDFYMDEYVQLNKMYYWNIYANIIDAIKEFNEKNVQNFGQKLEGIYYYANECDCEQTFLIKT